MLFPACKCTEPQPLPAHQLNQKYLFCSLCTRNCPRHSKTPRKDPRNGHLADPSVSSGLGSPAPPHCSPAHVSAWLGPMPAPCCLGLRHPGSQAPLSDARCCRRPGGHRTSREWSDLNPALSHCKVLVLFCATSFCGAWDRSACPAPWLPAWPVCGWGRVSVGPATAKLGDSGRPLPCTPQLLIALY